MNVLSLSFCFCLILSLFSLVSNKNGEKFVSIIIFICVWFIHAFVDMNSVPDLYGYSLGFNEVSKMTWVQCVTTDVEVCKMERGFALLLKIFSAIGLNFRCFLFFNATVISVLFYKGIEKYSSAIVLSSILFLLTINSQSIYILRQYLVMAVFFYSFRWIIDRKPVPYFLMCFLCFFIHQSAIVLVPIYFLYGMSTKQMLVLVVIIAVLLRVTTQFLVDYFGTALVGYSQYMGFEGDEGQNATEFIIKLAYLVVFVWFLRKDIFNVGINRLITICLLLNCLLSFFGIGYGFMGRLVLYYSSVHILLIPQVIKRVKEPIIKCAIVIACVALNIYIAFWGAISTEVSKIEIASLF